MAVNRDPAFRTVRLRESYDLDAVDDFVDLVIDALEGRQGGRSVTPEKIEEKEFKVVRVREGYSMDDVDDWLDAAAAELRRVRAANSVGSRRQSARVAEPPPVEPSYEQVGAAPGGYALAHGAVPVAPAPAPPVAYPIPEPPPYPVRPPGVYHSPDTGHPQPDTSYLQADAAYRPPDAGPHEGETGYLPPDPGQHLVETAVHAFDPGYSADPGYPAGSEHQQDSLAELGDQSLPQITTPTTGLHHLEIWVRDIDHATTSFGWLFERMGWTLFQVWDNGRSWQAPGNGPYVVLERSPEISWTPYDRKAPGLNHLALAVPERWMVDRVVSEATTYGWRLMFPDRHPFAGGRQHYAAYLENEEGFEVEVVAP